MHLNQSEIDFLSLVLVAFIITAAYFLVKRGIIEGPVDFDDTEVGTVFIVVSYDKETSSAIMAPKNNFGKSNDYLVDQPLETGKEYELTKKTGGIFYLKEITT